MSKLKRRLVVLTTIIVIAVAGSAVAQIPDEFTNLKVLPKDIGKREMVNIMRQFAGALGVRCKFCHVGEDPNSLEGYDFASDDKETKQVARVMMEMVNQINNTHLAKLEKDTTLKVRCVTCHHGVEEPETIDNIVLEVAEKDGVDAAITRYLELREEYYGTAAYNFGAGPMNTVCETLARQRNDVEGAISVMKMNLEFHPEEPYSHLMLGQLYQAAGDNTAAIASVERSLELDPENKWAKGILEKLKAPSE